MASCVRGVRGATLPDRDDRESWHENGRLLQFYGLGCIYFMIDKDGEIDHASDCY